MIINAKKTKDINRSRVLNVIRKNTKLSRQEIAQNIGLTAPAVGYLVSELIQEGLVREAGRRSKQRGQPAIELELCADGAHALGFLLQRNKLTAVVVNLAGDIKTQKTMTFDHLVSPKEAIVYLCSFIDELYKPQAYSNFLGIGLATFGPLNLARGSVNAPDFSAQWVDVPLRDQLAEASNLTVYLDNDATAAAIGEYWYGAGQTYPNYLYVHFGVGELGGGFFLNGQAYRGGSLNAGEFGHMLLKYDGELRFLEDIVGFRAIAKKLGTTYRSNPLKALEEAFDRQDKALLNSLIQSAEVLAEVIASVDNLLDLDAIIFGGQASEPILQYLLDSIDKYSKPYFMRGKPHKAELILGKTGKYSAVLGAATLPIYDAFVSPSRLGGEAKVFHSKEAIS